MEPAAGWRVLSCDERARPDLRPAPQQDVRTMAKQTPAQKKTIEKTMRAFKDGELESSAGGAVKNPKQAIAIALSEAGASRKDAAHGGGAGQTTRRRAEGPTQRELYEQARRKGLPGRSRMTKAQLARALGR
jgi:hypothetical protein